MGYIVTISCSHSHSQLQLKGVNFTPFRALEAFYYDCQDYHVYSQCRLYRSR